MVQVSQLSVPNGSGAAVRNGFNQILEALASCNAGATAPDSPVANMLWYDMSANRLMIRNTANTAWIEVSGVLSVAGKTGAVTIDWSDVQNKPAVVAAGANVAAVRTLLELKAAALLDLATQAQAISGTSNSQAMTPFTTRKAIDAIIGGAAGSAQTVWGWIPYDATSVLEPGKTGLLWDWSIDGNVSEIITPNFEDGYDYALLFDGFGPGFGNMPIYLNFGWGTATWTSDIEFIKVPNSQRASGIVKIHNPRSSFLIKELSIRATVVNGDTLYDEINYNIGLKKASGNILRAKITAGYGSRFTAGSLKLMKRRTYAEGLI